MLRPGSGSLVGSYRCFFPDRLDPHGIFNLRISLLLHFLYRGVLSSSLFIERTLTCVTTSVPRSVTL